MLKAKFKVITDFLEISAKYFPDKTALVIDNKKYTYSFINQEAEKIKSFLLQKTRKSDIVAIALPNSYEFISAYFGTLKAGCICLLLPPTISDKSLLYQLNKTKPKAVILDKLFLNKIRRIKYLNAKIITYPEILKTIASKSNKQIKIAPNDISTIIFTSGTTSEPKGAVLKHKNVVSATNNIIEFLKWKESDIDVNVSPLTHSFGLGNIHSIFAKAGTAIIFRDAIDIKNILKNIVKHKATTLSAAPATLKLIMENYPNELKKCSKYLRFIQTNHSRIESNLIKKYLIYLPNSDFNYYYGLTEASRSTFINFRKYQDKTDTVGRPSPNVKLKIIDSKGKGTKPGTIGEICISGGHVIEKYWKNPQASKRIKNKWLYTKDAGYLDKDGFLLFYGRMDDVINVGGEKVSPEEVEETAKKFGGVIDACAVAKQDRLLGEVVKLYVNVDRNYKGNEQIIKYMRIYLENYKIPKEIEITNNIPRTDNGKLIRSALR